MKPFRQIIVYQQEEGADSVTLKPPDMALFLFLKEKGIGKSKKKNSLKRWAKRKEDAMQRRELAGALQTAYSLIYTYFRGVQYSQNLYHWQQGRKRIYTENVHFLAVMGNLTSDMMEEEDAERSALSSSGSHRTAELQHHAAVQRKAVRCIRAKQVRKVDACHANSSEVFWEVHWTEATSSEAVLE